MAEVVEESTQALVRFVPRRLARYRHEVFPDASRGYPLTRTDGSETPMPVPFVIEMKPHQNATPGYLKGDTRTRWQVTRAGKWLGDFESAGKAQLFVNAMRYIESVQKCGHLDAYPVYEYMLRNVVSLE